MAEPRPPWTDERVEQELSSLLRGGVILAALIVLAGAVLYLIQYGTAGRDANPALRGEAPGKTAPNAEEAKLRSVRGTARLAVGLDSRGIIQLGLLVLVATPVVRVLFSFLAFLLQRDRAYVCITLIVLGVLVYSLAGGQ